jgi:hypothetical protein
VGEFRWFSRSWLWFFNTLRYSTKFPLFKDVDDSPWPRNGSSWIASLNWRSITLFFTCSLCLVASFQRWASRSTSILCCFQNNSTVDKSAYRLWFWVLCCVFEKLFKFQNPCLFHTSCLFGKSKQEDQQWRLFVPHLPTRQHFHTREMQMSRI